MDTKQKVVLGALAILFEAGTAGCGNRQPGAIGAATKMDQDAAIVRAVQATLTAMAPAGQQATSTPQPTYSTNSMPAGVSGMNGVDDVYNISFPGSRLGCCKECYGLLVEKVSELTGRSGIPTYLEIDDDTNSMIVEYGSKVFNLNNLPESTIDTLLELNTGYSTENVTAKGDKFRNAVDASGHTLEEFASVLGGSYLDSLKNAYQIDFANETSGTAIPRVNIYVPGMSDPIQLKITDSSGKADLTRYLQLLDIAGVPGY